MARNIIKVLLSCLVLAPTFWVAEVRADAESEAQARYLRAIELYEEGVYDAALVEFNRAYELRPSYRVLYNMAQVRLAMQDYARALETFERYLLEGGAQVPEARLTAVRKEIARLEQRVARLSIETDVSGAEVLVDDALVGTSPLGSPVVVNSGVRRVLVRHPSYPPRLQQVSIAGGERQVVTVPLSARGIASAPAAPSPTLEARATATSAPVPAPTLNPASENEASEPPSRSDVTLLWSGWGTTAALAVAATSTAIAAKLRESSLADRRDKPNPDVAALEADATKVERLALATDIMTGAAVVAAGVSLWLTLRGMARAQSSVERAAGKLPSRLSVYPRALGVRTEF